MTDRRFRIAFDLSKPIEAPPPTWGAGVVRTAPPISASTAAW